VVRLLVGASLAPAIALALRQVGYDAAHVADVGLAAADDRTIIDHAIATDRWIVTFDLDFVHLIGAGALTQPSLVLLRTRSARRSVVLPRLASILVAEAESLAHGAIVVVGDQARRVRLLPIGAAP
jgi:predicted nuclease of predicted toxin-antitoxin system